MSDAQRKRRQAHRLIRKVIAFLRENEDGWEIRLEHLKRNRKLCRALGFPFSVLGCVVWDEGLIYIDIRSDALTTIVHEVLHVLHPDASEKDILTMERRCMKHITRRQAKKIWFYAALLMDVAFDL